MAHALPFFVSSLDCLSLFLIAVVGFMGLNVDDSQDCVGGTRAERDEEIEGGAERDRGDLQTNLITSLQNGITLLALELLTSLKVSEKE